MENQHRKISGYRELSQVEIDLMNKIKALGPQIEDLIQEIKLHLTNQITPAYEILNDPKSFPLNREPAQEIVDRHTDATPARWANMAATDFQIAMMKLTRAVAQPTFF